MMIMMMIGESIIFMSTFWNSIFELIINFALHFSVHITIADCFEFDLEAAPQPVVAVQEQLTVLIVKLILHQIQVMYRECE